jgi:hypothetical protein
MNLIVLFEPQQSAFIGDHSKSIDPATLERPGNYWLISASRIIKVDPGSHQRATLLTLL